MTSRIIRLLVTSNLLFSKASNAADCLCFSTDKFPVSMMLFTKFFSATSYCIVANSKASARSFNTLS